METSTISTLFQAFLKGFDWDSKVQVLKKVDEEIEELKEALDTNNGIEDELGDVLFTIVNLSRHLNIDPEKSLRSSINKFSRRFKKIESDLSKKNIKIDDLSLEELDKIWEKNKTTSQKILWRRAELNRGPNKKFK